MLTKADNVSLMALAMGRRHLLGRVELLPWILDHRDGRDLDIDEGVTLLLDAADVDVLDDVARLRIDHDRSARAVRVLPVGQERHRLIGSKTALGFLDQGKYRRHPVPTIDREKV